MYSFPEREAKLVANRVDKEVPRNKVDSDSAVSTSRCRTNSNNDESYSHTLPRFETNSEE